MRYDTYHEGPRLAFAGRMTPAIKALIIASAASFVLGSMLFPKYWFFLFGLTPRLVNESFFIWQPVSYLFLHGGIWHLLFNMFALWMFGSALESQWGTREFTIFYFMTGAGVGLIHWAFTSVAAEAGWAAFAADYSRPLIGSSGAVFGVLAAYGVCFPERQILFMLLFPMRAKYFVLLLAAIELYLCRVPGSNVAHFAHLSGMLIGYLYLKKEWNLDALREKLDDRRRRRRIKLVEDQDEIKRHERLEVDRILDKINAQGMESLSAREKKILKKASERPSSPGGKKG